MESEEFAVDVCRLNNFLVNNQLVQANAIAQRLESILQANIITSNSIEPEKNASFSLFRKVHMTRTYILAGNKDDALKLVRELASSLPKEKTE
jgi:hypothetical protein